MDRIQSNYQAPDVDLIRGYHAHIYFESATVESAKQLREQLVALRIRDLYISHLAMKPVGPHPMPMFEISFDHDRFHFVFDWLEKNRGAHTVMIHQVTGDDPRDHKLAKWMGETMSLDFSKLDPSPTR